jgi:hypothetical protein
MVNSDELIGTTENLTVWTRCRINRCRYKRALLYFSSLRTCNSRIVLCCGPVSRRQNYMKHNAIRFFGGGFAEGIFQFLVRVV